jgi:hypothetical protein
LLPFSASPHFLPNRINNDGADRFKIVAQVLHWRNEPYDQCLLFGLVSNNKNGIWEIRIHSAIRSAVDLSLLDAGIQNINRVSFHLQINASTEGCDPLGQDLTKPGIAISAARNLNFCPRHHQWCYA